jgi:ferritin-like protein
MERLGGRARGRPRSDFGAAVTDPKKFRDAAIMLEESTIAAFISQGANLTRDALAEVVPMVSVEARQVAWVRDLAGVSPAPRAADPARDSKDILDDLRRQGFIQ